MFLKSQQSYNNMASSRSRNLSIVINIFASYILFQGILYTALSVCSLLVFKCKLSAENDIVGSLFVLIYFVNTECAYAGETPPDLGSVTHHVGNRTYIISICYIVISSLWILTSISVLARKSCSQHSFCTCFKPWLFIILSGCVLDIVASYYHITDIVHSGTEKDLLEYLGINTGQTVLDKSAEYILIPSAIMSLTTTRLIIFWLVNFLGICFIFKASRSSIPTQYTRDNIQSDNRHIPHNLAHQQLDRHTFEPLKGGDDNNSPYVRVAEDPNQNRNFVYPKSILINSKKEEPTNVNEYSDRVNGSKPFVAPKPIPEIYNRPSNLEYRPSYRTPSPFQPEYRRDLNNGGFQRDSLSRDDFDEKQRTSINPPDDLRSQLPWSYFHPNDMSHAMPRHVLAHAEVPENPPFIPAPDYNVHSPKRERRTRSDRRVPSMEQSSRY